MQCCIHIVFSMVSFRFDCLCCVLCCCCASSRLLFDHCSYILYYLMNKYDKPEDFLNEKWEMRNESNLNQIEWSLVSALCLKKYTAHKKPVDSAFLHLYLRWNCASCVDPYIPRNVRKHSYGGHHHHGCVVRLKWYTCVFSCQDMRSYWGSALKIELPVWNSS